MENTSRRSTRARLARGRTGARTRTRTAARTTARTAARRSAVTGLTVAAALTAGLLAAPTAAAADRTDPTEQAARWVVEEAGLPGVVATTRRADESRNLAVGHADLLTGRQRSTDEHFRAGSITKTFVATVVLQLEAEGRLDLDDTVEHWLPGLVSGNGNDGTKVTVRQLLQHTSGLFNYTEDPAFGYKHFVEFYPSRYERYDSEELVRTMLAAHKPYFEPGTDWHYSNTGYLIAGLIIEKATGQPYAEEVRERILEPLDLTGTSFPGTRTGLPAPHPVAYSGMVEGTPPGGLPLHDVTHRSPTMAGAAGEVITTTGDLNTFFRALARGDLLPKKQHRAMFDTVPSGGGYGTGLGMHSLTLSCGAEVWGHDGGINGSVSESLTLRDGSHQLSWNTNGDTADGDISAALAEAEFCGVAPSGAGPKAPSTRPGGTLSPSGV